MDLSIPTLTTNLPLTPVFGDNVQDLLGVGALHVNPTGVIVVNSIADTVDDPESGVITLRDAINQANADNGQDLIVFERSLFSNQQTITLGGTELDITHSLDIIAPRDPLTGEDLVTVSGNNASRVFEIEKGATATLSGLIVADGQVIGDDGGGIKNSGTLTLDTSIVRNNSTTGTFKELPGVPNLVFSPGYGGGIYTTANSNLTVNNSTISGNSTSEGGGILNNGTSTVNNSIISGNSVIDEGGGIFNNGTSTVNNSTISGNSTNFIYGGGGIFNNYNGTSTVNNSTISGNSSSSRGGGIYNDGTSTVNNSTISGNSVKKRTFSIINISSNTDMTTTSYGGGIYNSYRGTLTLLFSTVTQNQAVNGGGVYQEKILSSSVTRSSFNVRNTIIAANLNSDGDVNPDVSGTFSSNGYNLIGDNTGSTGFGSPGDIVGTSDNPIDPRLAPLDFYGGTTQTIALLPDSPAIDAGDPTVLDTDPTTDQRGLPRVVNVGSDIGAFEFSQG